MRHAVTFSPNGPTVWAPDGATVLEAARQAGVSLAASCGGRGTCGGCGVRLLEGSLGQPDDVEFGVLPRLPKSVRLACRARVVGPVTVEPLVKFQPPSSGGATSRATSLYDFEDDDFDDFEAGSSQPETAAAPQPSLIGAVDLGTTNISALIIESDSGREIGRATVDNQQRSWGADVLTRLSAALAGDADELRDAAQRSVMACLSEAAGEPFPSLAPRLSKLVVSANSVMAPLFTGQDGSGLAAAPFIPPRRLAAGGGPLAVAAQRTEIVVLDPLGGFVGGDARAGVVACRIADGADRPTLLVDMGTNAEVVLAHTVEGEGRLTVASAPAGSALEGVWVAGSRVYGSEFVRLLAAARASGALDASGRIDETPDGVSRDASGVLQVETYRLPAISPNLATRMPHLSQLVVREFQLAKAAVRAAVSGVLTTAGVDVSDLDRILVAGAFGGAITPSDLVALGMVPPVAAWRIVPVGNTSLTGAALVAMGESADVSAEVALVDLVASPTFGEDLVRFTSLGT